MGELLPDDGDALKLNANLEVTYEQNQVGLVHSKMVLNDLGNLRGLIGSLSETQVRELREGKKRTLRHVLKLCEKVAASSGDLTGGDLDDYLIDCYWLLKKHLIGKRFTLSRRAATQDLLNLGKSDEREQKVKAALEENRHEEEAKKAERRAIIALAGREGKGAKQVAAEKREAAKK